MLSTPGPFSIVVLISSLESLLLALYIMNGAVFEINYVGALGGKSDAMLA